jgi:splicing factor, arginine/serine-rich 4/5/6
VGHLISAFCCRFVVNFDVERTRERDLERHFEQYGRLRRVQIKRNYAFVQV